MDDSGEQTDAQLLRRSRDGDRHAFSELWRRHAPIAVAYARSLGAAPPDPEDVVSDAFLNILHLLRAGKGPEDRFRPYLLTTVRNTWVSASRRAPATLSIDDAEHPVSSLGAIDVDGQELVPSDLCHVPHGRPTITVTAHEEARLLLLGGPPFGEAIVMWWNFIGRTHDEIVDFRRQWQADVIGRDNPDGRFGTVHGYDGPPLPAPELPTVRLRPRS